MKKLTSNSSNTIPGFLNGLKDPANYYGEMGQKFFSNSDIGMLLDDPKNFGNPREKTKAMIEGSFLHTLMLEPERAHEYTVVDASTRNTKEYKETVAREGAEILLLKSEAVEMYNLAAILKGNLQVYDLIYDDGATYEQPGIGEICGKLFKGRADVITSDFIYDIKTTSSINDFRFSARKYHYDSQAYIYSTIFGRPVKFIAIDKSTGLIGIYDCSEEFLERGANKVQSAIELYDEYYGHEPTKDITQLTFLSTL